MKNYFYIREEAFNKNRWFFAILGVIVYYVGTFIERAVHGMLNGLIGIGFD